MRKVLFPLLIISLNVLAGQSDFDGRLPELVKSLSDNNFDSRETAYGELSNFPAEYAARLLEMSRTSSAETSSWLRQASKAIFLRKIVPKDERYRRLFGFVGIELSAQSRYGYDGYDRRGGGGREGENPEPYGYRVTITFPSSEAEKVFRKWDLIIKIDGKYACDFFEHNPYGEFGFFKAGDVHEFEVWRYKDLDKVYERGWVNEAEDEHEVITVKAKVEVREPQHVDLQKLNWLKERAWREFLMVQDGEPGLEKGAGEEK
jgi:hypothetical protein